MTPMTYIEIGLFVTLAVWEAINDYRINHPPKKKRLAALVPYTVKEGDTVWGLARRYNTTIDDICLYNPDLHRGKPVDKDFTNPLNYAKYCGYIFEDDQDYILIVPGQKINVPVWEEE